MNKSYNNNFFSSKEVLAKHDPEMASCLQGELDIAITKMKAKSRIASGIPEPFAWVK